MTDLLNKLIPTKEDIGHICMNGMTIWAIGKIANAVSNSFFHFNLNRFNSIDHAIAGTIIGTYAYRKAGGGLRGVVAGVTAATILNTAWESFEGYVYHSKGLDIDTISDIAVVYGGNFVGFFAEKAKGYMSRNKVKKEEK